MIYLSTKSYELVSCVSLFILWSLTNMSDKNYSVLLNKCCLFLLKDILKDIYKIYLGICSVLCIKILLVSRLCSASTISPHELWKLFLIRSNKYCLVTLLYSYYISLFLNSVLPRLLICLNKLFLLLSKCILQLSFFTWFTELILFVFTCFDPL